MELNFAVSPWQPWQGGDVQTRKIQLRPLREALLQVVSKVIEEITPNLTVLTRHNITGWSKKDKTDITREVDMAALYIYEQMLIELLPGTHAMICSEENPSGRLLTDTQKFPDLLFIIDPVDNTDGGTHGSPAYTAVSVYDRISQHVVAAAVGDIYRREIFYADDDVGAVRFAMPLDIDKPHRIAPNAESRLSGAYITMYSLKPSRLLHAAKHQKLLANLGTDGRIDNVGGAAALCKIAAGYFDAAIETAKGFQVYDLFPGAYILSKAGGLCVSPENGSEVSLQLTINHREEIQDELKRRQRFIAAANQQLALQIVTSLGQSGRHGNGSNRQSLKRTNR